MNNGQDEQDTCPNYGIHKYFLAGKTYTDFVLVPGSKLYERIEYALLGCNCGSVFRHIVEDR